MTAEVNESPLNLHAGLSEMDAVNSAHCPQCNELIIPAPKSSPALRFCQYCRLPLIEVAGKYRIERRIGEGGGGIVYLARHLHLQLNPYRVVKFLHNEQLLSPTGLHRFAREIEVTAVLSQNNEHIVRIYDDFGHIPPLGHFYVMELLEGLTLRQKIEQYPDGIPFKEVIHIFRQLCQAILAIHQAQIVHRDLKPQNIFLIERDNDPNFVKVMDFGIAKMVATPGITKTRESMIGTPLYMSPEQCMGLPADERSDIYALGILLYELIAGRTPFLSGNLHETSSLLEIASAHMYHDPTPFQVIAPHLDIPPGIEAAVMQALAKPREARFQTVQAFQRAIEIAAELKSNHHNSQAQSSPSPTPAPLARNQHYPQPSQSQLPQRLPTAEQVLPITPTPPLSSPIHPGHPSSKRHQPAPKRHAHSLPLLTLLALLTSILAISIVALIYKTPVTTKPSNPPRPLNVSDQPSPTQRMAVPPRQTTPTQPTPDAPPAPTPTAPRITKRQTRRTPRPLKRSTPKVRSNVYRPRTKGCPTDPSNGHWVNFRVRPAGAQFTLRQRYERHALGICALQSKRRKLRLRITRHNYQPCVIERIFRRRQFRIQLKRNGIQEFDTSLDYCLK